MNVQSLLPNGVSLEEEIDANYAYVLRTWTFVLMELDLELNENGLENQYYLQIDLF